MCIRDRALHSVRQDVMQILFAYLMQEHILAHELFEDRNAKQLEATCSNSVFDMLKWVDYIVKRAIEMCIRDRGMGTSGTQACPAPTGPTPHM